MGVDKVCRDGGPSYSDIARAMMRRETEAWSFYDNQREVTIYRQAFSDGTYEQYEGGNGPGKSNSRYVGTFPLRQLSHD